VEKIDIDKILFKELRKDYICAKRDKKYQEQFQSGLDYMEAMIKLFGVLNISVLKSIDEEKYKKVFSKNFNLTTSLGAFKSLATHSLSEKKKPKQTNNFYDFLYNSFHNNISIDLYTIDSLLYDYEKKVGQKEISSTNKLLDKYAVTFRNKFKGHGASFKEADSQKDKLLSTLETILKVLEKVYKKIDSKIDFFISEHKENDFFYLKAKYEEYTIELLPIIIYVKCDKFSCLSNENKKIFFYNDGKLTNSVYLDYTYNHFYLPDNLSNDIQIELKNAEINYSSSDNTHKEELFKDFIGRKDELKTLKDGIFDQTRYFTLITGDPGIGKSALVSQLTKELEEEKKNIQSYIYFIRQAQSGEGANEVYSKLKDKLGIYFEVNNDDTPRVKLTKLFKAYSSARGKNKSEKLLVIIDGLDELKDPIQFINDFPLINLPKNINIIFTTRKYKYIIDEINKIEINSKIIELDKLSPDETRELILRVLPTKEFADEEKEKIINDIVEKSEQLPIYIYFITQELIKQNTKEKISEIANQLPSKLNEFYTTKFEQIESLARDILRLIYFSRTSISLENIYDILSEISKENMKNRDFKEFKKVFNEIEVFLRLDENNQYSFYHLSVKEAVLNSFHKFKRFDKAKIKDFIFENDIEQYGNTIDGFYYLDKKSDEFEFLASLVKYLKQDNTTYKDDNLIHIYNRLIYIDILQKAINYDDMIKDNYKSLKNFKPSKNKMIEEFFSIIEDKKAKNKVQRFEIRYAYEVALFIEDYDEVLKFYDMYNEFILDIFLDICTNINKKDENGNFINIQKFIELKDEWENSLTKEQQNFFVEVLGKHEEIDDSFCEVLGFIKDEYRIKLILKLSKNKIYDILGLIKDPQLYQLLQSIINHNDISSIVLSKEFKKTSTYLLKNKIKLNILYHYHIYNRDKIRELDTKLILMIQDIDDNIFFEELLNELLLFSSSLSFFQDKYSNFNNVMKKDKIKLNTYLGLEITSYFAAYKLQNYELLLTLILSYRNQDKVIAELIPICKIALDDIKKAIQMLNDIQLDKYDKNKIIELFAILSDDEEYLNNCLLNMQVNILSLTVLTTKHETILYKIYLSIYNYGSKGHYKTLQILITKVKNENFIHSISNLYRAQKLKSYNLNFTDPIFAEDNDRIRLLLLLVKENNVSNKNLKTILNNIDIINKFKQRNDVIVKEIFRTKYLSTMLVLKDIFKQEITPLDIKYYEYAEVMIMEKFKNNKNIILSLITDRGSFYKSSIIYKNIKDENLLFAILVSNNRYSRSIGIYLAYYSNNIDLLKELLFFDKSNYILCSDDIRNYLENKIKILKNKDFILLKKENDRIIQTIKTFLHEDDTKIPYFTYNFKEPTNLLEQKYFVNNFNIFKNTINLIAFKNFSFLFKKKFIGKNEDPEIIDEILKNKIWFRYYSLHYKTKGMIKKYYYLLIRYIHKIKFLLSIKNQGEDIDT